MKETYRHPIDPTKVFLTNDAIFARGRDEYKNERFVITNNFPTIMEARGHIEEIARVHPENARTRVLGVGIDIEQTKALRRPVFDNQRVGVWIMMPRKVRKS